MANLLMIIENIEKIKVRDIEKFAWSGVSQFTNREACISQINLLHSPDPKQKKNIEKQAEHIRKALLLAKEYYQTSRVATLATKPVLLYYSCMALALAEILLKQDGRSSLDKARGQHSHHGLEFVTTLKHDNTFTAAVEKFSAKPNKVKGKYRGTFELWRRTSRHLPIVGNETTTYENGTTTTSAKILYFTPDTQLLNIDDGGVSFGECLCRLPFMQRALVANGYKAAFASAAIARKIKSHTGDTVTEFRIHPTKSNLLENLMTQYYGSPAMVNYMDFQEAGGGLIINITNNDFTKTEKFEYANGINIDAEEVYLCSRSMNLNEFGNIYVGLFMLSNLARYYPDIWVRHIEEHTPLSLVAQEFCEGAAERMALMSYSELSRVLYIQ